MTETPPPPPPESKAEPLTTHHLGLIVEMFEDHKKLILEGMAAMEERITRRFDERFERIEMRLDVLELAVRKNSEDIARLSKEVEALRVRVARVEQIVDKIQRDLEVADLDRRVTAIEETLNIVPPK